MTGLAAATFSSRTQQGGCALGKPYDGQISNLTAGPKPSATLTPLGLTATAKFAMGSTQSTQSYYIGNSLSNSLIRYAQVGAHQLDIYANGASISNIDSDIQIYNYSTLNGQLALVNSRICTDINAQYLSGSVTGAIDAGGLIKDCDISGTSEDGMFPGYDNAKNNTPGQWTVVEGLRAVGPGFNYYMGFPYGGTYPYSSTYAPGQPNSNTGLLMTESQVLGATSWSANLAVTNGEFISANTAAIGPAMYQCVSAGTLGSETPSSSWPTATSSYWSNLTSGDSSQPFTSGTALMIFVGGGIHSDGMQTTGRQCVVARNCIIEDFANSCALIQNAAGNSNATPLMNWIIENCVLRGGGNYDFYVQSQTLDSNYAYGGQAGNNELGGFIRNSATDWEVCATPGKARPWHISFRNNTHLTATSPYSPRQGTLVTMQQAIVSYGAIYVDSEAKRDELIAAQFGWSSNDPRLAQMRMGTYDYTTMPTPISSVLEARLQSLISAVGNSQAISATPGACDARGMIVWERNNLNQNGQVIIPASGSIPVPANTAVTDADGYYIGD